MFDVEQVENGAIAERRYILTIAREKIAALNVEHSYMDEWDSGFERGIENALEIIDELLTALNV